MYTLEEKVDLILQYITTDDSIDRARLKRIAAKALKDSDTPRTSVPENKTPDIETVIEDLLTEIGVPDHVMGYRYSVIAIKLAVEDPNLINHITKELYPLVAKEVNSTDSRVERAIRHGVEIVWNNPEADELYRLFGNTISSSKGKPVNSQFLATCAKEVKRRMKKMS